MRCLLYFQGDPFVNCILNPCSQSPCGINADCSATGARAVCKCRPNYEGDPFVQCNLNPCQQSPCGINADCTATGQRAVCKCRGGYIGDPFSECRLEPCSTSPCGTNADCTSSGRFEDIITWYLLTIVIILGQLYANASQATQVTRTQTAALTHAPAALVARELSVKIMAGPLFANAHHNILEIPM